MPGADSCAHLDLRYFLATCPGRETGPHNPSARDYHHAGDRMEGLAELMGISPGFTRQDLNQARIRRAAELHPDGLMASSEADRQTAEEKLKAINAAYDELLAYAA